MNRVSPCLFIFFSASITAPTCDATIISFHPCALNTDFQHFISRFNNISYFMDIPERRVWDERRPKDRVALQIILIFTFTHTHPQTIYKGLCKCIWQIFTLASCKCKNYIYTLQHDKCKCKKLGPVSNLHLHWIYIEYIHLLSLTCRTLVLTLMVVGIESPNNDQASRLLLRLQ
jgi:hypothetical protein